MALTAATVLVRGLPLPDDFFFAPDFALPLALVPPSASAAAFFAAWAAWRSARFSRISIIVGQSSLKQSFHGLPARPRVLTLTLGVRWQIEQFSSSGVTS